ncbi:MAG: RDD family protein [Acidimicrobiaceae bacterium]|nr:RDD family protein [Acidimicrobiaceae bacterium]MYB86613.1 RDD family protein [Acidimicrobiaceae bacterium]MYH92106.1 RDD family protein [Acidimicrobiaceae bacterium]
MRGTGPFILRRGSLLPSACPSIIEANEPAMSDTPPPPPEGAYPNLQAAKGWASLGNGEVVELAHAAARLAARVLDVLIMVVVFITLLILVIRYGPDTGLVDEPSDWLLDVDAVLRIVAIAVLAVMLVGIVYEVALTATRGQTLGKMATRIRVVGIDDGSRPGWGRSIMRWTIPLVAQIVISPILTIIMGLLLSSVNSRLVWVPMILLGWAPILVVYGFLTWDRARQGLHDKAAGTLVIKV